MSERSFVVCDACGAIIGRSEDRFQVDRVVLRSAAYRDAAGELTRAVIGLDFCPRCARRLAEALERLASARAGEVQAQA